MRYLLWDGCVCMLATRYDTPLVIDFFTAIQPPDPCIAVYRRIPVSNIQISTYCE